YYDFGESTMFICDISVFNKYGKQRLDEMLRPLNLDWHMLVTILIIEQVPGISQGRLNPFLQTDKANVTKLLQAMEKKELIRRETDSNDSRNKVCFLTEQGSYLTPRLNEILESWEATCFRGINTEDLLQFQRVSAMIMQNLKKDWRV
ncbi:MAG: MarR family transcriptional regulator, partial [Bacteroidia bacterium]|nr:MarR family transcriptional regulator [Bacteroidia bacterium]